jgi:hypothetical protein
VPRSTAKSTRRPARTAAAPPEPRPAEARFQPGDRVRVRVDDPPRHIRTPAYIQGRIGEIAAIHGVFRNPESRAHGGDGLPPQTLYLVSFAMGEVWGLDAARPPDRLLIDLYEPWLERV